jgi:hypothetical protein
VEKDDDSGPNEPIFEFDAEHRAKKLVKVWSQIGLYRPKWERPKQLPLNLN